ncbi:MAG TPA: glutamate--tRNA ligase [Candidatus Paceibacterota bacterium]
MNPTENNPKKIVTRFAPSPTGFMHVGGVRTALYAWAFARKNAGTFILRIEDTDKEREVEGSIEQIMKSLQWLSIGWDEGPDIGGPNAPYLQSQRLETYKKYAQMLADKGLAYADPYTPEELEAFRKEAEENKKPFLYRNHRPENPPVWDGNQPLRLKIQDAKVSKWHDEVRGDLEAGPEALDDFILMKSDGYPTYNFAHIIDDLYMGVTHIFRADEFISSTPKFLALYEALEIDPPKFVTLPPIMGPDGKKKLGKRDGAKDILTYKDEGFLPDAMVNFLAFIGWNPGDDREVFTPAEFIQAFDIEGIQKAGGKLNEEKLVWFNKEHMKKLSDSTFRAGAESLLPAEFKNDPAYARKMSGILPILRERVSVFKEITEMVSSGDLHYFFMAPEYNSELLLCAPKMRKGREDATVADLKPILEKVISLIEASSLTDTSTPEECRSVLWDYADSEGRGIVLWAVRAALTGKERSPDPFAMCSILGPKETAERLRKAVEKIG